jgi:hypothetical protein
MFGDGDGNGPELESAWTSPILENDLDWPSSDILVSYKAETHQITWSKLSTGEILKVYDCAEGK